MTDDLADDVKKMNKTKKLECFGTANMSDACSQCPDNEECATETCKKDDLKSAVEKIFSDCFLDGYGEDSSIYKTKLEEDVLGVCQTFQKEHDARLEAGKILGRATVSIE